MTVIPGSQPSRRTSAGSACPELWLVCTLFSLLVLAAARGDLWLDEVWSLELAQRARSMGDIFLRLKHDNNHPINTLSMYLLGRQENLSWYRLLPALSGIGSLFLIGHVALKKWGRLEALLAVAFAGTSYPVLLYVSEARGYAPIMLCAVAAYAILDSPERGTRWRRRWAFGAVSVLGILSHASFFFVMLALAAFSLASESHAPGPIRERVGRFMAWHALPFAAFLAWYWWFLREMEIGGGPVYSPWSVVDQTLTLLLGLQELRFGGVLAVVVFLLVISIGTSRLRRARDDSWVFYPVLLIIAPTTIIVLTRPEHFYIRYLVVGFPFFYLLLARVVAEASRSAPRLGRSFVISSYGLYLAGESAALIPLLRIGRGHYAAALAFMLAQSPSGPVLVASDHDFRNRMMVEFYAARIPGGSRLSYVSAPQWQAQAPAWFLVHSQDPTFQPAGRLELQGVGEYRYATGFRFAGISGWSWFLFKRELVATVTTGRAPGIARRRKPRQRDASTGLQ